MVLVWMQQMAIIAIVWRDIREYIVKLILPFVIPQMRRAAQMAAFVKKGPEIRSRADANQVLFF